VIIDAGGVGGGECIAAAVVIYHILMSDNLRAAGALLC